MSRFCVLILTCISFLISSQLGFGSRVSRSCIDSNHSFFLLLKVVITAALVFFGFSSNLLNIIRSQILLLVPSNSTIPLRSGIPYLELINAFLTTLIYKKLNHMCINQIFEKRVVYMKFFDSFDTYGCFRTPTY